MDRTQSRYERFAQLRTAYPAADYDEIMARIYEEELDADQRAHDEMLDSIERERENAY